MLIDTNILLRLLQPTHPQYEIANHAIKYLRISGKQIFIAPQNLVEVWVVSTRPLSSNGLGMTIQSASDVLARLHKLYNVLIETHELYSYWEKLVKEYKVSGKPAHDIRLVAIMKVHGIKSILTFNTSDFNSYSDIEVIHPADVKQYIN